MISNKNFYGQQKQSSGNAQAYTQSFQKVG